MIDESEYQLPKPKQPRPKPKGKTETLEELEELPWRPIGYEW